MGGPTYIYILLEYYCNAVQLLNYHNAIKILIEEKCSCDILLTLNLYFKTPLNRELQKIFLCITVLFLSLKTERILLRYVKVFITFTNFMY